jgi:hypothetical protein
MERIRIKLASGRVVTEDEIWDAGYALLTDPDSNVLGAINRETLASSSVEAVFAAKFEFPIRATGAAEMGRPAD